MARKQAKRRKPTKKREMPTIPVSWILTPVFVVAAAFTVYEFSGSVIERPVASIEIMGPMKRVDAVEIEAAINDEVDKGFFSSDVDTMREAIQSLDWIDQARVARRWPDQIVITVSEQDPAAVWDDRGLINTRGELFIEDAAHLPAELPRLAGPQSRANEVAERYLHVRRHLMPLGLVLRRVEVNKRGAWSMKLANGVEIRLGKDDVDARTELLVSVVADQLAARNGEIRYVDLRYESAFSIGWVGGDEETPMPADDAAREEMLASRGNR